MRWFLLVGGVAGCATPVGTPQFRASAPPVRFTLPLEDPARISLRIGMDHDPVDHPGISGDATCRDYAGRTFPHCYDQHTGTDFILAGGFPAMDSGSLLVLAAFDGTVTAAVDTHYDRCHLQGSEVSCDGRPIAANRVTIAHREGLTTHYLHLQQDSLLVSVGDDVLCGDPLARVGSSGLSAMPHLHFEVEDTFGAIDPYGTEQTTLWSDQGPEAGLPGDACD